MFKARPLSLATTGPLALTWLALLASASMMTSCGPAQDAETAGRTTLTQKWLTRAQASYKSGDFEDAEQSVLGGIKEAPKDNELRVLAAKIALTRLDFSEALKRSDGVNTPEAHGLRGRAYWYLGKYEEAADEMDLYLRDPSVKDDWARDLTKLARSANGRQPYKMEGGVASAVELPKAGHALIVPCELEGEKILAMITTANAGLVVDSNSRKDAAWVNMRFGDMEVQDVPAFPQDLGPLSTKMGAPIKALLGMDLLRHLHPTMDRRGDQFVVRREDPPPPPDATKFEMWYLKGGAMAWRAFLGKRTEATSLSLFVVDTSQPFLVALTDEGWKKSGVSLSALSREPGLPEPLKSGILPDFHIASFDFSGVPGIQGFPMDGLPTDVDIAGVLGASVVSSFRITLMANGKYAWLEPDPNIFAPKNAGETKDGGKAPEGTSETKDPAKDPGAKEGAAKEGAKPKTTSTKSPATNGPAGTAPGTKPAAAKKPDAATKPATAKPAKP